jgi:rod shape-determining protein MreC
MRRSARTDGRVDGALFAIALLVGFVALFLPDPLRARAASSLRGSVVAPLVALEERFSLSRRAIVAYDSAVRVVDSVALRAHQADALADENARLRRLLGLGARLEWGFVPAEALAGAGIGDDFTLTLTAGANAGVTPFAAVLAPEGIVGMVQAVDPRTSVAITWPHPDFRVSAMSADGAVFGIVHPHLATGAARWLLELRGVPFRDRLTDGALVVSSGLGGTFPRGIPVGRVVRELQTAEGWARTYLVRPIVQPGDVTAVLVLTAARARTGVAGAWADVVDPEAQARRVAAAGDSLRRLVAADSAQRAVGDSAVRAGQGVPAAGAPPSAAAVPPARRDTGGRP